jgi:hypothetical protein
MIIGLDFDNTIVNYDAVFYAVAREQKLVPAMEHPSKQVVRNYLREQGREDEWTELQGFVYGTRMEQAELYPGIPDFLARCKEDDAKVYIISHKTPTPYQGPAYDLHGAARSFIEVKGLYLMGLARDHVFFEVTKEKKIERIIERQCDVFLDDLPEFLALPGFPAIQRYLFDPKNQHKSSAEFIPVQSWDAFSGKLFDKKHEKQ